MLRRATILNSYATLYGSFLVQRYDPLQRFELQWDQDRANTMTYAVQIKQLDAIRRVLVSRVMDLEQPELGMGLRTRLAVAALYCAHD